MSVGANDDLAARVRQWAALHCAGPGRVKVRVEILNGTVADVAVRWLPAPGSAAGTAAPQAEWVPTDNQLAVLDALEGKALKTERLVSASGVERRQLFRELPELKERGLIRNHSRFGYFRPDAPPEELAAVDPA